jgi:hypothetical protein
MALVDGLTPALPEGASGLFRVTRAAIAEKGRTKLPMARPAALPNRRAPPHFRNPPHRPPGAPAPVTDRASTKRAGTT